LAGHEGSGRDPALSDGTAFRRATAAEASAVRDFTRRAYARWVPVLGREPKPMTADYDAALRHHRIDLLTVDGVWAGLIQTVPAEGHLLVENVAVDPDLQGRGLGRRLMAHAEALAAGQGLGEIRLYTNALMGANIRLYAALGYGVDRTEQKPDGRTVVHMSKRLTR
jgi:ribosomal protein S18 acetylase RimI-like enzyme